MSRKSTVIFEEKYDVDINAFSTTSEINDFIAKREGKKALDISMLGEDLVTNRGDILPLKDMDIHSVFDKIIRKYRH